MSDEVRYWDRLGIYVTRQFAQEYVERSQQTGITGEYLDAEIDEYEQITTISPLTLEREIEEIFSQPYRVVALPPESQGMLEVLEMDNNKKAIIMENIESGMTKEEAKASYTEKLNEKVASVLGIEIEEGESEEMEETPHEEE
jgi:hypothetical protein